jgi:hypothetical protein
MTLGPGKYDDLCTDVRERAGAADGAIVIIIAGSRGSGFSVQADLDTTMRIPAILENLAAQIRRDLSKGKL